ncbi:CsgG/HfaB family protein [Cognatishimia sp. F0-27]|uniref:CsgG/HfaB family protein n=1 Tax=Cognatishimia sp. F0-27 TaxID=2816855 RepID=UPI001D0C73C0|nr:CsgG/HfaB family protein [Cognatishimia sp. F0-27]MCC1494654.1 curlin [Cognatishimia sp. F0-27]
MKSITFRKLVAVIGATAFLAGCDIQRIYEGPQLASVGEITEQNRALRAVAPPTSRKIVAVYEFPDLTGQYKERDNVQSLSRAVTQAGAPLLIKALQDTGNGSWFSVLDRASLQSVVQERQIIERMREQYRGEQSVDPSVLGPLMHADIIISGGIVGYDTNIETGGFGARYLGIGANTEWKYDVVTVNLRAISTSTGEVLANVLVRKPIASFRTQGDVFRYVELDKLLEVETGIATNEPKQIAVEQAIEKAVLALIAEGAMRQIWGFKDKGFQQVYIDNYRKQLFNDDIPASAGYATPPKSRLGVIPQTRPRVRTRVARAPVVRVQQAPRPQAAPKPPAPPPAGSSEEALG